MRVSVVIPAYMAADTLERTLQSVVSPGVPIPANWQLDIVVVSDGSPDVEAMANLVSTFPGVRLVRHQKNKGMCAARNTGIDSTIGDIVTILDADDSLVAGWPVALGEILAEWPPEANACFAACRNPQGDITAVEPDYNGWLTLDDFLNERHSGEYLPLFRGDYIRKTRYVDLEMRKSCGIVSYLRFTSDGPFWITSRILRIYDYGTVTGGFANMFSKARAHEAANCYEALFARYGELYQQRAPHIYRTKLLRFAIYRRFAGLPGALIAWRRGASLHNWKETVASLAVLLVGQRLGALLLEIAKRTGAIRRYG